MRSTWSNLAALILLCATPAQLAAADEGSPEAERSLQLIVETDRALYNASDSFVSVRAGLLNHDNATRSIVNASGPLWWRVFDIAGHSMMEERTDFFETTIVVGPLQIEPLSSWIWNRSDLDGDPAMNGTYRIVVDLFGTHFGETSVILGSGTGLEGFHYSPMTELAARSGEPVQMSVRYANPSSSSSRVNYGGSPPIGFRIDDNLGWVLWNTAHVALPISRTFPGVADTLVHEVVFPGSNWTGRPLAPGAYGIQFSPMGGQHPFHGNLTVGFNASDYARMDLGLRTHFKFRNSYEVIGTLTNILTTPLRFEFDLDPVCGLSVYRKDGAEVWTSYETVSDRTDYVSLIIPAGDISHACTLLWDGRDKSMLPVPDGEYLARMRLRGYGILSEIKIEVVTPADVQPPTIDHSAVTTCRAGYDLRLQASVTDDVGVWWVTLRYRIGAGDWEDLEMRGAGDQYAATLPASSLQPGRLEYWILAGDRDGNHVKHGAESGRTPHVVVIRSPDGLTGSLDDFATPSGGVALIINLVAAGLGVLGVATVFLRRNRPRRTRAALQSGV